jgi:hypothetical protein
MPAEPGIKRTVAFSDRQNLFHAAKNVFGYIYPSCDLLLRARGVRQARGLRATTCSTMIVV